MTLPLYDKAMADFNRMFRKQEAENGICSDEDVCEGDREPPVLVGMFDPIPMPRDPYAPSECIERCGSGEPCNQSRCPLPDPYGCENPVSQSEEE